MADRLAAEGQRVLALATDLRPLRSDMLDLGDLDDRLVLVGIVGLIDPPRAEVVPAIRQCRSAGLAVKMITGDHAQTARAIGHRLVLADDLTIATGAELDAMDAVAFARTVRNATIFARTSPAHKLRIVEALQADGAVVAMTGDGVNDAPALKRADVGVAMGVKGTEAAKQAAEMVLADDNFASIVAAVHEGRTVYDNLKKVIGWTLPTNGGEALIIISAIALGVTLPVTAIQILWINMVTAVTLGLALAFEPPEPEVMRRPPRPPREPLLSAFLIWRVTLVSLLVVIGGLGMLSYALHRGFEIELARTLVVNTVVVMEIAYLFSVRHLDRTSMTWTGLVGTPSVLLAIALVTAAQFAFTYLPFMQGVFETRPVPLSEGLMVIGVGVVFLAVLELEKVLRRWIGQLGPR
jgi:magnesium-transporting ATPase (P-type)